MAYCFKYPLGRNVGYKANSNIPKHFAGNIDSYQNSNLATDYSFMNLNVTA